MRVFRPLCVTLCLLFSTYAVFAQRTATTQRRATSASSGAHRPARPGAATPIVSDSKITLNGKGFDHETFALPQAEGDWFVLASDAHVAIDLKSQARPAPLKLTLQWFGKQSEHVVTHDNNKDSGGDYVTFFLAMNGQDKYAVAAQPEQDQSVTITVDSLDDHDLQAHIAGKTAGDYHDRDAAIEITGTIHLHRETLPTRVKTGTYRDCDETVYDKLYGAEARSMSECESKFDFDARQAIHNAFAKVGDWFRRNNWTVQETRVHRGNVIARSTEHEPFRIDFATAGAYSLSMDLDPSSRQYQALKERFDQLQAKMGEEVRARNTANGPAFREWREFGYQLQGSTKVRISVVTNMPMESLENFRSEHSVLNVPGAAYAVASSHVQSSGGGDIEQSLDVAIICLGAWSEPTIEKHDDGGERIALKAKFNKAAPLLSVQNLAIRIEANRELTDQIVKQIDFAPLEALLH